VLRRAWRRHSLTIVLIAALAAVTAYILLIGPGYYRAEQLDPGEPMRWGAYWRWWTFEYALALPANILVGILFVVLTKKLREAGSPESGDDKDEHKGS
jgi:hypothetical protein